MQSMPIIWRFLLGQYLRVLVLVIAAFIAILLTISLEEIAQIAAMGAPISHVARFVAHQIPYIVPIALPISGLISALLLAQRMSTNYELTALRSSGYGLRNISSPILLFAAGLSMLNLLIVSEVATDSQMTKRLIRRELKSLNPLVLLKNERLTRVKGFYAHANGTRLTSDYASDVLLAYYNKRQGSVDLLLANEMRATDTALEGRGFTWITTAQGISPEGFDYLWLENAEQVTFPTRDLASLIEGGSWRPKDDYLRMGSLLDRTREYLAELQRTDPEMTPKWRKFFTRRLEGSLSEIVRRFSIAIAVFTFTLLGVAYGMVIDQTQTQRRILTVLFLSAFFLVCYFAGKSFDRYFYAAVCLYLLPHAVLIALSCRRLRRTSMGYA